MLLRNNPTASPVGPNAFIEFVGRKGRMTGISVSEANYYIIICGNDEEFLKIDINELKKLCTTAKTRSLKDGRQGYIIPLDELKKYSTII